MKQELNRPFLRKALIYTEPEHDSLLLSNLLPGQVKMRRLDELDSAILSSCRGVLSLPELSQELSLSNETLQTRINHWQTIAPGLLACAARREEDRARRKRQRIVHLLEGERIAAQEPEDPGALDRYHRSGIDEAFHQFDSVETTVSHMFREPHLALAGRSYGQALCDRLLELKQLQPGSQVLEIGGGTGVLTEALLSRLRESSPQVYESLSYTLVELSPTLQESQRKVCKEHSKVIKFFLGNIENVLPPGGPFDLVLSNEVIADLSVGIADVGRLESPVSEADHLVKFYGLSAHEWHSSFAVNTGVIRLLERLKEWLKADAKVVLTEYGSENRFAGAVDLGGHREHTIHFGHVMSVARQLELSPQIANMGEFLGFRADCEVVELDAIKLLVEFLLPFLGHPKTPLLYYDRGALERVLGERMNWLQPLPFKALGETRFGPYSFAALILNPK